MSYKDRAQELKQHGVTVLEGVLPKEQVSKYRELIVDYFADGKNRCPGYGDGSQTIRPDAINDNHFKSFVDILDNEDIMGVLKEATDNKPRWVHHFDVHKSFGGAKGWHSDAQLWHIDDENYEHDFSMDDYNVYRIAIYFQDHQEDGGGLYVRPGSHIDSEKSEEYYIGTEPGDVILFDARIKHKGGRNIEDRCTVYGALGKDNEWSKLHAKGAIERQEKQNQSPYVLLPYLRKKLEELGIVY